MRPVAQRGGTRKSNPSTVPQHVAARTSEKYHSIAIRQITRLGHAASWNAEGSPEWVMHQNKSKYNRTYLGT